MKLIHSYKSESGKVVNLYKESFKRGTVFTVDIQEGFHIVSFKRNEEGSLKLFSYLCSVCDEG